jgi:hypothetical protein
METSDSAGQGGTPLPTATEVSKLSGPSTWGSINVHVNTLLLAGILGHGKRHTAASCSLSIGVGLRSSWFIVSAPGMDDDDRR